MYIIVWRHSHREPFLDTDSSDFLEQYYTKEDAVNEANKIMEQQPNSPHYLDYEIYEKT